MHGMENVGGGLGGRRKERKNLILSGVDPWSSKDALQRKLFWDNLCLLHCIFNVLCF